MYRVDDSTAIIQTVDLFPPIVDDPYLYGQIAAANALSDVYAMGGSPKIALNILCIPEDLPGCVTKEILQGGYSKVMEAGAVIAGGHSIMDVEPKYGLAVTGFVHPDRIMRNDRAQEGDVLILTKALGTGILTNAMKAELLTEDQLSAVTESMLRLNATAAEQMSGYHVHSCTDVTGFGIAGHAFEMAGGSGLALHIDSHRIPVLPGAEELARMGIIPAGTYNNRCFLKDKIEIRTGIPESFIDIIFDPQTSGGLLIALPEKEGMRLLSDLRDNGECAAIIGWAESDRIGKVIIA